MHEPFRTDGTASPPGMSIVELNQLLGAETIDTINPHTSSDSL
jgi:hypothetical protein